MSKNSKTHVKAPVHGNENSVNHGGETHGNAPETRSMKESLAQEHHGESTKSLQDDKRIGQHNHAGRPPLMEK